MAVILALSISNGSIAAETCTYDQDDQIRVLRDMAGRYAGGTLDEAGRRIVWPLAAGGSLTYEYGGCTHLGSFVTRRERLPAARGETQVLAVAVELAAKYWEKPDREDLVSGLTESRFTAEEMNGKTFYHVRREFYSAFYVEHEYRNGIDRVAIAWSRNF
ncbi:MAG: hypothetical protein ACYC7J_17335 [Syntrophales bacterium]